MDLSVILILTAVFVVAVCATAAISFCAGFRVGQSSRLLAATAAGDLPAPVRLAKERLERGRERIDRI